MESRKKKIKGNLASALATGKADTKGLKVKWKSSLKK